MFFRSVPEWSSSGAAPDSHAVHNGRSCRHTPGCRRRRIDARRWLHCSQCGDGGRCATFLIDAHHMRAQSAHSPALACALMCSTVGARQVGEVGASTSIAASSRRNGATNGTPCSPPSMLGHTPRADTDAGLAFGHLQVSLCLSARATWHLTKRLSGCPRSVALAPRGRIPSRRSSEARRCVLYVWPRLVSVV